ncbi:MAG: TatD family hydrolase [Bacteroidetes bacterium]|nr:TatD family hydrolase [Bacteroidota bacterium]
MIDTHCHLNSNKYNKDIDLVVKSAKSEGVEYFIVPATMPEDLEKTIKIAEKFAEIYCALGVHPHESSRFNENVFAKILNLSKHKKVVAIGEIGLDYHYDFSTPDKQISAFERQLEIGLETKLPIILHNREADKDIINILKSNSKLEGVCHCYSSGVEVAEELLEMGFYISFTANITFSQKDMTEVVKVVPMDKIMLETDSPYMTPHPNRGKRNVPQNVIKVAEKISSIKNISLEEVIKMTTENAKRLFRIPILVLSLFLLSNNLYSQDYYDDEYEVMEVPDPYYRKLGFGPLLGTNTFVDRYPSGNRSFSYEGLFSAGGYINYRFLENFIFQAAYSYSENTKAIDRLPDSLKHTLDRSFHNAVEFSIIGMVIPKNMVNFYASLGTTYFMNQISANRGAPLYKHYYDDKKWGLNTGIGIFVNFSLGNMGTLVVNAEWKLGFRLDEIQLNYDPREMSNSPNINIPTTHTTMSSVPRGGIIWYIPFF